MAEILSITRTFSLGQDGVTYFETQTITYDDETQDVTKRKIGTATDLANHYADVFIANSTRLASDSRSVDRTKRQIVEMNTDDTNITTLSGVSPIKALLARVQNDFLKPGWTIDPGDGVFVPLVFTVTAQNQLRYNINGTGAKNAFYYGGILRLMNFGAAAIDTEFFISESGTKFYSLPNRVATIKKP
jgi:hypothetical protein